MLIQVRAGTWPDACDRARKFTDKNSGSMVREGNGVRELGVRVEIHGRATDTL